MTISVTDIGANTTNSISINVPANSLVVVGVSDLNAGSLGAISDGTNTYTVASSLAISACDGGIAYHYYSSSFTGTVTYTAVGIAQSIAALYATGTASSSIQDSAVTVTGSAAGNPPAINVTSGTPSVSGELFAALLFGQGNGAGTTYTQDTAHGWAAPFDNEFGQVNAGANLAGGTLINVGAGTKVFNPTLGSGNGSRTYGWIIVGFKPTAAVALDGYSNQIFRVPRATWR